MQQQVYVVFSFQMARKPHQGYTQFMGIYDTEEHAELYAIQYVLIRQMSRTPPQIEQHLHHSYIPAVREVSMMSKKFTRARLHNVIPLPFVFDENVCSIWGPDAMNDSNQPEYAIVLRRNIQTHANVNFLPNVIRLEEDETDDDCEQLYTNK